jgi:hypothetical protein
MSKPKSKQDEAARAAATLATEYLTSAAAARLLRQSLDTYAGTASVTIDVYREDADPAPGYRVRITLYFEGAARHLASDRRRLLEIIKFACDRTPNIMESPEEGVLTATTVFAFDDGDAAVVEMAARRAQGSLLRIH